MTRQLLICACAQWLGLVVAAQPSDAIPVKIIRIDTITAQGKPDGQAVTKEIGREGGSLLSEDGRLELIFPEEALRKSKKITIQPVSAQAANGRGKAYRLEPSGLQFDKPVGIIFHYAEEETAGTLAELKGIAWQDEKGKWDILPDITLDTLKKTLTASIFHFSSYASFDKIILNPSRGRVKVGRKQDLWLSIVNYQPPATGGDDLPPLPPPVSIPAVSWSVNGISGGDQYNGWISFPNGSDQSVVYNAPVSIPDQNPVAVAVHLKGLQFVFNKKTFRDPMLVSNLLIYDRAYRLTMNIWVDNSEDGMCTMRVEDEGRFTVVLEGVRSQMKEIWNEDLRVRTNPCKCPLIWKNKPLAGPINIAGARKIDVTPASLPDHPFPRVRIMLQQIPSAMPLFGTSCPVGGGTPTAFPMLFYLPPYVEFEANNEAEQVITLADLAGGNRQGNSKRYGLRIVIKKLEEDE